VQVAFVLSVLLHAALFLAMPRILQSPSEDGGEGAKRGALAVRLTPKPAPPPPVVSAPPPPVPATRVPEPAERRAPPPATARSPSAPRVMATPQPSPLSVPPAPAEPATPAEAPVKPPAAGDLASFIEARRRARDPSAAPQAPMESEQERVNREAAARLGLDRPQGTGSDLQRGGGIFQIHRLGYADAEFIFFGWNRMMSRNTRQMVEVQRGDHPSIETAVVRRMIGIIRDHERGNFTWESRRLGRDVTLSARAADTAELEAFLMREFFPRP